MAGCGPARRLLRHHHGQPRARASARAGLGARQLARWLSDDGAIYVSVPNAFADRDQTFQHFHFAHVHSFTPQTLIWAGEAAGLEVDPRISPLDTTLVFRKASRESRNWPPAQGRAVAAHFEQSDPLRFLFSGLWIRDALRRLRRASRDSLSFQSPLAASCRRSRDALRNPASPTRPSRRWRPS